MINLIIKGTISDAIDAASSRGIILRNVRLHSYQVLAVTGDKNHRAIQRWFNDGHLDSLIPGFGYPIGSLLHYSRSDDPSDDHSTAPVADQPDPSADMMDG